MDGDLLQGIAYHEAGHAVVAHLLGERFHQISITSSQREASGHVLLDAHARPFAAQDRIVILWAGGTAERRWSRREALRGHEEDLEQIWEIAFQAVAPEVGVDGLFEMVSSHRERAEALLADPVHWSAVEALAAELVTQRTLDHERAMAVIQRALHRSSPPGMA